MCAVEVKVINPPWQRVASNAAALGIEFFFFAFMGETVVFLSVHILLSCSHGQAENVSYLAF